MVPRRHALAAALLGALLTVAGHYGLSPPAEPLVKVLAGRRVSDPRRVSHAFRHLHQASSYWLEGVSWNGDHWGEQLPAITAPREGESRRVAVARTLEPLLGRLEGRIDGGTIRVTSLPGPARPGGRAAGIEDGPIHGSGQP